jgi:2-polyprenyl-3-methyl-5-hydroxy-6-metoxy-1,4-benzoquinol methylase
MQADFWNLRYSENGFAYGTEANDFLRTQTFPEGAKILCLAEGEGRNAVYLAEQGYEVTAIDMAYEGIEKTRDLAQMKNISVKTICANLAEYEIAAEHWDGIVIIFGHFPEVVRKCVHQSLYKALKKGGKVVIEAYSKDQLKFKTGGPMDANLLYSVEELQEDFKEFGDVEIIQLEREIHEGRYHNGMSSVLQLVARKK